MFGWTRNSKITKVDIALVFINSQDLSFIEMIPNIILASRDLTPNAKREQSQEYRQRDYDNKFEEECPDWRALSDCLVGAIACIREHSE
jgi:hypothetical protein